MINFISNNKEKLIFVFSVFLLFLSFYYNEDGSGGGAKGDFEVTYGFILALQDNLLADPTKWTLVHTPLHFMILSVVTKIISNPYLLRFLFCIFSILLPLFFFKTILFSNKKKNYLSSNIFLLSAAIIFIPSFRYTSIWANDLITSLIFFTVSIYFFKKWEQNKKKDIDKNSLLQILFLVLATYTRQYFAVFFIYFLFQYFKIFSYQNFLKLFMLCVLSSLPVFYYVYLFPELLTGQHISLKSVNLFVLGNSSILSLTLIPIILVNSFYRTVSINDFIIPALISFFVVSLLTINFDPFISWKGGGVNHMISKIIFKNNIYFYFTSFLTITIFIFLYLEKKENLLILTIILFMFFSSQVYQRYYEPMFFIIFFTLIKTNLIDIFLKKLSASLYLLLYFVIYYMVTISDFIYRI